MVQDPTKPGGTVASPAHVDDPDVAAHVEPPHVEPPHVGDPNAPGPNQAGHVELLHVEPLVGAVLELAAVTAAVASAAATVTISRNPPATIVIINRIVVPQDRDFVTMPQGNHTLETAIVGKAGDTGVGTLRVAGGGGATAVATIGPGQTQAISDVAHFNV